MNTERWYTSLDVVIVARRSVQEMDPSPATMNTLVWTVVC